MTDSYKGGLRAASPETRKRVSSLGGKAGKGRKLSDDHKRKIKEAWAKRLAKEGK